MALSVDVLDAATGQPIPGAAIQVSGSASATVPCDTQCFVPGIAGTYTITATAPGHASSSTTVAVQGTMPACGCPTVESRHVVMALSALPEIDG